jgi:hypothetical protein
MPIIDVSQKSYRSLVKAAYKRGMSIDRFIQKTFESELTDSEPVSRSKPASAAPTVEKPVGPVRLVPHKPVSMINREDAAQVGGNGLNSEFEALWGRIEQSAGNAISTKRGQDFTYEVESGYLTVRESGARIPRSQFKKALAQWPQNGPSNMRGIYAASVVWAVLADGRILDSAA